MKHILPFVFLFIFSVGLSAQIAITPNNETQDSTLDLTDVWNTTKMHAEIHNNGNADALLRWEITQLDGPVEWETQLCVDVNSGGCFAWGVGSNVDSSIGLDVPLALAAGGESIWDLGVKLNGVAGCGTFEITVTDTADLNTILATSTHTFRLNVDANCDALAVSNFEKKSLKLFPNPATEYFTLTDNNFVNEIQIFNIVGKRMIVKPFQNGEAINIGSYPNGLYLIRMLDNDGEIIKTTRLTKR